MSNQPNKTNGAKPAVRKKKNLLYDPQTSGGLLISVSPEYVDDIMKAFEEKNMDTKVSVIGKVVEKGDKLIRLY